MDMAQLTIINILIIHGSGPDTILLQTDLPPATFPWNQSPNVKLDVAADTGEEYCEANFPRVSTTVVHRDKIGLLHEKKK